jgi:acetoin utilization deacetylase AcuC-like enzyme
MEETDLLMRLQLLEPRPATVEELQSVHTSDHIEQVRRLAQMGGGHLDADTYVSARSFDAALMAAGGVVRAVEAVLAGEIDNAFALVRPPGHHATPMRAMGFCLFNNIAVAARAALAGGAQRVFIVDFDVHHGNGTQDVFAADPAIFYCSTHQYPFYPGTGHWSEIGVGAGKGAVLDVPLPPGVGDGGYAQVLAELIWPLAERFRPDLILVSAGYDAHWNDPLAHMNLSLDGYAWMGRELVLMAEQLCEGRLVLGLEGGYQLDVLACGVINAFYAMLEEDAIIDPFGSSPYPEQPVDALISQLKVLHGLD